MALRQEVTETLTLGAAYTYLDATNPDGSVEVTCNWVHMCSGYYDYERGHAPAFAGAEDFTGRIVHPQKWTEDIDYAGKRIVVFSGGAAKNEDELLGEVQAIRDGGGNGSIIGRNSFQRPKAEALALLNKVMDIYA